MAKRTRSRKGAPGIVDVAARAGVSPATVSRFFNAPDVVRLPTRKRIEQAASDLGYIRNRMAGAMHNQFSGTMGLIVPTIDNAIFAEFIQAFSAELNRHDCTMLIATHDYDLNNEIAIVRSLLERRIDAVAVIGLQHEQVPLDMLASRNVPVIAAWNYRSNSNLACVGADNFEAGEKVGLYLKERGHKDIALVFPPTKNNDRANDRYNGVLSALSAYYEDIPSHRNVTSLYDIGTAKHVVESLLCQHSRPSAIICGNDVIAQGAVFACHKLGVKVPDQVSIIGIGDFRGSAHMEPSLTTLRIPAKRIGEVTAERLCNQVRSGGQGHLERVKINTEIMERGSVMRIG